MSGKNKVDKKITPIRLHLRGGFSSLIQGNKQQNGCTTDNRKIKPRFHGEALTQDDVCQRVTEEEEEK